MAVPVHPFAVGIKWYVTPSFANPVLTRIWFSAVVGTALFANPVTFPELGVQVHVNSVPGTFEVRVMFVAVLLHICLPSGLFERFGEG